MDRPAQKQVPSGNPDTPWVTASTRYAYCSFNDAPFFGKRPYTSRFGPLLVHEKAVRAFDPEDPAADVLIDKGERDHLLPAGHGLLRPTAFVAPSPLWPEFAFALIFQQLMALAFSARGQSRETLSRARGTIEKL